MKTTNYYLSERNMSSRPGIAFEVVHIRTAHLRTYTNIIML